MAWHILARLSRSVRSWLPFELVVQAGVLAVALPGLRCSLNGAMALSGYAVLTGENVLAFAASPACVVLLVLWVVLLALVAAFDLCCLQHILSWEGAAPRPCIRDVLRTAFWRTARLVRPANLPLVPCLAILVPLARVGATWGLASSHGAHEALAESVRTYPLLIVAFAVLALALALGGTFLALSLARLVADDVTFSQALRLSRVRDRGCLLNDVAPMVAAVLMPVACATLVACVASLPLLHAFGRPELGPAAIGACVTLASQVAGVPVAHATCLELLRVRGERPSEAHIRPPLTVGPASPVLVVGLTLAAVIGAPAVAFELGLAGTAGRLGAEVPLLCAHRGGAAHAPENTMAAFRRAVVDGADVCELDVQQSADGRLFVSHDPSFRRISGVDRHVWELSWEEIAKLDAVGDRWADAFPGQGYPLLDDVIVWARGVDMPLNIELKPTGHERDFERAVVDVVRAHDFTGRCTLASQSYETIERLKACAPEVACTYVMTFAYGDLGRLAAADALSIRETSVTPALVRGIHASGRPVMAWGANSWQDIAYLSSIGVDQVIVDDVPLGCSAIGASGGLTEAEVVLLALLSALA